MLALIIPLILFACAYLFTKNQHKYWQTRGVQTLNNQNVILGDVAKTILGKQNFIITIDKAYYEFKSRGCKFAGIYCMNNPMLLVVDPEIARCILAKDSEYFNGRGVNYDELNNPLSAHLFNLDGEKGQFIRKMLMPMFTGAKLKTMCRIIEEKFDRLCKVIEKNSSDIHMINLIERTGIDIFGHLAFGLNCNALENESSPFYQRICKLFKPNPLRMLYIVLKYVVKNHANMILMATDDRDCNDFFLKIIANTIKYRKDNNIRASDLLGRLIELMEPKDGKEGLTIGKVSAQAFVLFVAAHETGARALNMILYELGNNKQLQHDLREEILDILSKNDEEFSYEILNSSKLLEIIVKENFRKNPPAVYLNRVCTKKYRMPESSVVIEAGTPVIIPIYSFHNDPNFFPNPDVFDPSRFLIKNNETIKPFTFLPFGGGPRHCIGNRLAQFQLKTAIIKIIKKFEISVSSKTEEPLVFNPITENRFLTFKQKIYFDAKKIDHDDQ